MSRRIEVELTSERDDGTWTWRAAGARQPKGTLDGKLLYPGAKVGDVVRAEADFEVDGIFVSAVLPPRGERAEPQRLEVLGPRRQFSPVTTDVGPGARRERRRERPERGRERPEGRDRRERRERPAGPRPERPKAERRPRPTRPAPPPPPEPRPKPKRLRPGRAHRDAVIESLAAEQRPVAEQLVLGGLPAVRAALEEQNAVLRAEGRPEVKPDNVLALAEELLPRVRLADWLDRAEAARAQVDEVSLRDLRSVVVSAEDVARDDAARELAAELRRALDRRVEQERQGWLDDVVASLDAGRVVRALRLSSRPPEPGFRFPQELQERLAQAASGALTPEAGPDRWATVLDAVAYAPVRRSVTPLGPPPEPGEDLVALVRKHAGRLPTVAALFGVEPPAPAPPRGRARRRPPEAVARPGRPARPPGAPPPPPPRPRPPAPGGASAAGPAAPDALPAPGDRAEPEAGMAPDAPARPAPHPGNMPEVAPAVQHHGGQAGAAPDRGNVPEGSEAATAAVEPAAPPGEGGDVPT